MTKKLILCSIQWDPKSVAFGTKKHVIRTEKCVMGTEKRVIGTKKRVVTCFSVRCHTFGFQMTCSWEPTGHCIKLVFWSYLLIELMYLITASQFFFEYLGLFVKLRRSSSSSEEDIPWHLFLILAERLMSRWHRSSTLRKQCL